MSATTTSTVKAVPDGYHTITPYLILNDCTAAIEYYKSAFNATEIVKMPTPEGNKVAHAELKIGNSMLMLADECVDSGKSPKTLGMNSSVGIVIYTENADSMFNQAVTAGGTVKRELKNQFYGDRSGTITDPFGYEWTICSHIEDVSPEEMEKRVAAEFGKK